MFHPPQTDETTSPALVCSNLKSETNQMWTFVPLKDDRKVDMNLVNDLRTISDYPKELTTYQIVAAADQNICMGVQLSPQNGVKRQHFRVMACNRDQGRSTISYLIK